MFGTDDENSDQALIQAVRKRLMAEIGGKHRGSASASSQRVINNIYGSHGESPGMSGHMGGAGNVPPSGGSGGAMDPLDYFVDISREDLPVNPETGKPSGWKKHVKRYTKPKDSGITDEKKK